MTLAGTVTSAALLVLIFLWAEGQPVKGLIPNNRSLILVGIFVTAAGAALMCSPKRAVQGGEARLAKTVIDKAPLSARLDTATFLPAAMLLSGAGAAPSPAPWRAPSAERQGAPPPVPAERRAPAYKKGLSWRAKARCCLVLAVPMLIIVFVLRAADGEFYCAICMETVPGTLKFIVGSCGHAFCSSCVAEYVAAKLAENLTRVECPDPVCGGVGAVEPESCRGIISPDLLDKWELLLCESALGAKKVYCPYADCSAPLLADGEAGAAAIAEAECPHCHRLFCARCAAPWHADIGCREFQRLGQDERGRDDLLLRGLAGRKRWQRCPKCQMYVEKSEGCNYIKCRCGYSFCYRCASKVSAQTHYCKNCKR